MRYLSVLLCALLLLACGSPKSEKETPPPQAAIEAPAATEASAETATVAFADVQPVFTSNCAQCHGDNNAKGSYSVTSHAGLLGKGKDDKPNIVAGDPEASLAWTLIRDGKMPPSGKLADAQIELVRRWIAEGARPQ